MRKGALRKQQIIQTASECFARDGIEKTSLGTIAKAIDINPSLLLYHFNSLEDIFKQSIENMISQGTYKIEELMKISPKPSEMLKNYTISIIDHLGANKQFSSLYLQLYHQSIYHSDIRELNNQIIQRGLERFASIINMGVNQGEFKVDNVDQTAMAIFEYLVGVFARLAGSDVGTQVDEVKARAVKFVLALVNYKELS